MPTFRRTFAATVAAAGLFTATAATAANPAQSLSVAPAAARASAPAGKSKAIEGSTATIISIGILAAFTAIVLATTGGGDDNGSSPASP